MYQLFIGGNYVDGKGKKIDVINPADNTVVDSFCSATKEQAEEALETAQETFKTWGKTSVMQTAVKVCGLGGGASG